jgi:hypothetical protein
VAAQEEGPDRERGSVMMLVPAGLLILLLFAAIAVDSAGAFLAQRQLTDALAAAANDAATAGLDNRAFYSAGAVRLDPAASATVVCTSLAAQGDADLHQVTVDFGVSGATIELRGTAEVDAAFGRLIPHFGIRRVAAEVRADAQEGPAVSVGRAPTLTRLAC